MPTQTWAWRPTRSPGRFVEGGRVRKCLCKLSGIKDPSDGRQIRNPKHEIRNKSKAQSPKDRNATARRTLRFEIRAWVIRNCFGFRYSCFELSSRVCCPSGGPDAGFFSQTQRTQSAPSWPSPSREIGFVSRTGPWRMPSPFGVPRLRGLEAAFVQTKPIGRSLALFRPWNWLRFARFTPLDTSNWVLDALPNWLRLAEIFAAETRSSPPRAGRRIERMEENDTDSRG